MSPRRVLALACVFSMRAHAQDSMTGMDMPSMQGGAPRDADYSDGYRRVPMRGMDMPDGGGRGMLLLDRFEYSDDDHGRGTAFLDGEAWYGSDSDKLWLKFEGRSGGAFRGETLWDHAVSPFWDVQLGLRHDAGGGPARNWVAFGVQGLAPYRIETEAALYLGSDGRSAARVRLQYEALLTQKWILQPNFEMDLYGQDDRQRGLGSGLSDVAFGLRLRYEVTRQFAPYLGVAWQRDCGGTADFARARGERPRDTQVVAGMRFWF